MEPKLQHQIAFFLTGSVAGSAFQPVDGRYRSALFARYSDLGSLRYDLPLVLGRNVQPERSLLSLSRLMDEAVAGLGEEIDGDRVARHGYRIERELRRALAANGPGDLAAMWDKAAAGLAESDEAVADSAKRLWKAFGVTGELVDADRALPGRAVHHAWSAVQRSKEGEFRQKAERLLFKLHSILAAETASSPLARAPEVLKAGVGSSFAGAFNFEAMSNILEEAKPGSRLRDDRRERIRELIRVLERQQFYPLDGAQHGTYSFSFDRCSDALTAYNARCGEAIELVKTLAIAELEVKGEYREAVHDVLFESFGANGLDAGELAQLPEYLICTDAAELDPAETAQMIELLAAGLPFKVLVRTDDVLEPSAVAEGHVTLGLRARQLVDAAIGLTDVFVFQSSAANLFRQHEALLRGLTYDGPALFSIFSGVSGHTGDLPAYLVAAAATESRVFPSLVYDPSAGADWATRLNVNDNPSPDDNWPVHSFTFEGKDLRSESEDLAFTLADFMAMDDRFYRHCAIVPRDDWNEAMVPVNKALEANDEAIPDQVPALTLVDDEGRLQRAIIDNRILQQVRRCRTMWHSLQELGGIHNSHAERMLDIERRTRAAVEPPSVAYVPVPQTSPAPVPDPAQPEQPAQVTIAIEPVSTNGNGDGAYIETARCTSCNECTQINPRLFAYDDNKQAYIADPDAGTFRQLVEAAEGCQVSIIHPGKPRNPKEPGLEDLIKRAAEFN